MNSGEFLVFLLILGIVAGVLCVLGGITADQKRRKPQPTPDDVQRTPDGANFTGSGLHLAWPTDFTLSTAFDGFEQAATGASVLLTRVYNPFADVAAGFIAAGLASRGMQLVSSEEQTHDSLPARLLRVTQQAHGTKFSKWILAFGDDQASFLVVAAWPEAQDASLAEPLHETVLSAHRIDSSPVEQADTLPFTVASGDGLLPFRRFGNSLSFTLDGENVADAPGSPMFIAAVVPAVLTVTEHNAFARAQVQQIPQVRGVTITAQAPIRVDGLEGVEIVARGTNTRTGQAMALYQAILFDQERYFRMQGVASLDEQQTYLPIFKTMARTFRRPPLAD